MTRRLFNRKWLKTAALTVLSVLFIAFLPGGSVRAASEEYEPFAILYNGSTIAGTGYMHRGTPYIPLNVLLQRGNSGIFSPDTSDMKNARLNMDLNRLNVYIGDGATTQFIKNNAGTVYIPLRSIDGELYAPLNTTAQFAGLGYSLYQDTLYLANTDSQSLAGRILSDNTPAVASLVESDGRSLSFAKDEVVLIRRETPSYYQVESLTGTSAYIMKDDLRMATDDERLLDYRFVPGEKPNFQGQKINLAWQYVGNISPAAPEAHEGIDILAPTWFDQIVEGNGNIENNGDLGYTRTARENGAYVWATITNNMSTTGSTNYTTKVLADTDLRNKTIAQYLFYACLYEVDGINIDYEDVRDSDRNNLTAFVREMRKYTERLGLTLSIDTLIPKPWTVEYDYAALGKTVDYIAVMTYDEHYSTSPSAGSVSSLPWADKAIQDLLTYVDGRKILMGIPMYTRLWTVSPTGKQITNRTMTMTAARELIQSKGLTPRWLPETGQYYAEYINGSNTDKIWLEDPRSIAGRLTLVYTYGLAGSACWQYSQGEDAAWDVFEAVYKRGLSPGSLNAPY
ncbi:MAG TPA: glycosyl hydrolase family 18 protein [Anaerovoracaceae bacterium]|mgnify:CR=1 FL=1|nr:glycosyl hydrolase family 18 protein [Bacillota bacterium]HRV33029.1 glycosyl hydrolase family 18 protein [Anaerovoracaceae bacterium]